MQSDDLRWLMGEGAEEQLYLLKGPSSDELAVKNTHSNALLLFFISQIVCASSFSTKLKFDG